MGLEICYARRLARWARHTRLFDSKAVRSHYDVGDDFFGLWLDPRRVYSCAYYRRADDTLDVAQEQKLDHVCRKLRLAAGERLLDIGCGWGALIFWAAEHYGVEATGITLSRNQAEHVAAQGRRYRRGVAGFGLEQPPRFGHDVRVAERTEPRTGDDRDGR